MRIFVTLTTALFCISLSAQQTELKNFDDSLSYAIGLSLSNGFAKQGLDKMVNPQVLSEGLTQAMAGENTWSSVAAESWLQASMGRVTEIQNAETKQIGVDFLAENGKRKGVETTESGLQYEVLKKGKGESPTGHDKVTVHYTGTLIDGTKFDSSVDRGEPATFGLTQVIKGWTQGLQLMETGSVYRFYIPQELGYGCGGAPGGAIPPCSTLLFDVELISVLKQ